MSRKGQVFTTRYATNCSFGEGGESSNCPSKSMTSKKMVLGGILAFFMSMVLIFSVGLLTGNLFDRSGKEEQSIALTEGDWWINDGVRGTGFDGGDGSPEHPYEIQTAEQLAYLSYMVYTGSAPVTSTNYYYSGVYFKQTANIDLSAHYWQPIGTYYNRSGSTLKHYFSGTYDGGGYTISGINTPSGTTNAYSYQGLFGYVYGERSTNQAEIKNVGVIDSNIQGYDFVGGIVGYLSFFSTVSNCYNEGSVTGSSDVGGIIGCYYFQNSVKNDYSLHCIKNCYNVGNVTGIQQIGGIIGSVSLSNSTTSSSDSVFWYIQNCYNTSIIKGEKYVGGIFGYIYLTGGNINSSYNLYCRIESLFNLGEVQATDYFGSLGGYVGISRDALIDYEACYYGGMQENLEAVNGSSVSGANYSETLIEDAKSLDWYQTKLLDWEFVFIWELNDSVNNGYPYLVFGQDRNWWLAKPTYYDTTWEGKGTKENPYLISTAEELAGLSYMVYTGSVPVTSTYHYYSGVYFKQTADIDLSAHYWQPIGIYYDRNGNYSHHYFSGNYDGDGYTISGIVTPMGTTNGYSYQGLFGYVSGESSTNQAEIKNVGVINSSVQGYSYIGEIAGGASNLVITNCYNTGNVTGSNYVGGIVGYASSYATITNCYNTGSVTVTGSGDRVGGIVGYGYPLITNCYNTGSVTGSSRVGGIVGSSSSTITNCYNTGSVTGSNYVGGITGYLSGSSNMSNCYNLGEISGSSYVGGLIGYGYAYGSSKGRISIKISNSFNTGDVVGTANIGGILGYRYTNSYGSITVTNCYYGGDCTLEGYSETLATDAKNQDWIEKNLYWDFAFTWKIDNAENNGYPILRASDDQDWWLSDSTYYDTIWEGSGTEEDPYLISTAAELAGLSYLVYSGTAKQEHINGNYYFSGVYFKQTDNIDLSEHYWQPIGIYYDRNGTTTQHYFSGTYDGDGFTVSGIKTPAGSSNAYSYQGLFGYVYGRSSISAEIKNVGVINSNIQGYQYVGGVVGYADSSYSTITNCYNTGSVTGGFNVGGIVGSGSPTNCYNTGSVAGSSSFVGGIVGSASSHSTITNCYNTGDVTGSSYVGGITGSASSYSTITNCYNTGDVTGSSYVGGVVGHTYSTITYCYNTGTVTLNSTGTGTSYVGGIVGSGSPTNCFNLGKVTGTGSGTININGITANGTPTNCYYGGDCTLEGYSETLASDAKNQDWLFKNLYWDFACVWAIDAEINDGYPYLDPLDWWLADSSYYDTTWEGKGTIEEPFLISTAKELAGLSYLVYYGTAEDKYINGNYYFSGVYFKQTADIDLSEHYWQPIGIYYDRNGNTTRRYFSGIYNGDGFTVSGIKTPAGSSNAYSYQGLFGYVYGESSTNQAEIKNVRVINSNIQGYQYVGGIVGDGYYYLTITNCYNTASVTGSSYVGGIAGYAEYNTTITNCYNTGDVTGSSRVGGIVGNTGSNLTITNCYNTGSVTLNSTGSNTSYVGGVVGYTDSTITNCYNTGIVTVNSTGTGTSYVGGISGRGYPTNCFNLGEVIGTGSGTINIDGITANGTATNCYYGGDCTLEGYSETLVTDVKNQDWIEKNLYWDFALIWEIDSVENNGYPILRASDDQDWWLAKSTYYDTTWEGKGTIEEPFLISTAQELAGISYLVYYGLTDATDSYYFSGIYFKQTADIDLSAHYWQPIGIYYDRNGTTTRHYFSGNYDGNGFTVEGVKTPNGNSNAYSYQGLFGCVSGQYTNTATIKNLGIVNSNIQGYQYVGGIAGYTYNYVEIKNCYNESDLTSTGAYVGGIVGYVDSSYCTIENCYNLGDITSSSGYVGGILGGGGRTISNCYNAGNISVVISSNNYGYVGGIAGSSNDVYECYNTGSVSVINSSSSQMNVGGINGSGGAINSYNTGSISGIANGSGSLYIGGITGNSSVYYSYNIGRISGTSNSTGTVYVSGIGNFAESCFNLGAVVSSGTGQIVKSGISHSRTPINSYYGGNCENIGGVGGTDTEGAVYSSTLATDAKTRSWYDDNMPLWDFSLIWKLTEDNNGYPVFLVETEKDWWLNPNYIDVDWAGSGTENDPYLISTAEELAGLSYMIYYGEGESAPGNSLRDLCFYDGKYFKQTADIDLSAHTWQSIGFMASNSAYSCYCFAGNYDGDGHKISGINSITSMYGAIYGNGLFGAISRLEYAKDYNVIENLGVIDSKIMGAGYIGGIVGIAINPLVIENCYIEDSVIGQSIETGSNMIGGLVGAGLAGIQMTNCYTENCNISGETAGGLIGINGVLGQKRTIDYVVTDSYNNSVVSGESSAGLIGGVGLLTDTTYTITGCYNIGKVTGEKSAAGITASSHLTTISNCYNLGEIEIIGADSTITVGGIVAGESNRSTTIYNSYNAGDLIVSTNASTIYVGGLYARGKENSSTIYNSFNTGNIYINSTASSGTIYVGGVGGFNISSTNCFNVGGININTTGSWTSSVGGVIGVGTASNSYYGGACLSSIGGIAGADVSGQAIYKSNIDKESFKDVSIYNDLTIWYSPYYWDIVCVWKLSPQINNGYPYLDPMDNWFDSVDYYDTEWKGRGTKNDPYLIENAADLAGLAYLVNTKTGDAELNEMVGAYLSYKGKYFKQTADIDMSAHTWNSIGGMLNSGESIIGFSGIYDGGNHEISGLYIPLSVLTSESAYYNGLFGILLGDFTLGSGDNVVINSYAQVKNLGVTNSRIVGEMAGNIVGMGAYGAEINNCYNEADLIYGNAGILGYGIFSNVIDCYNSGRISGENSVAGIIGVGEDVLVENCSNSGDIIGDSCVGGIVGENYGDVLDCYNQGNIFGGSSVGGIAGNVRSTDNVLRCVDNCKNSGEVSGTSRIGGIIGSFSGDAGAKYKTQNCSNAGKITGSENYTGGIVGQVDYGIFYNCINYGEILGSNYVGGIVGANSKLIENCVNSGEVSGQNYVGGLVGQGGTWSDENDVYGFSVVNSINHGEVNGSTYIGGIAGAISTTDNLPVKLYKAYSFSDIVADVCGGGIVGYSTVSDLTFESCLFEGSISSSIQNGEVYLGGILGSAINAVSCDFIGCYVRAEINVALSTAYACGLISNITMADTTSPLQINKCAVIVDISSTTGGELTNSRAFYFSSNLVDTETILNSYAIFNDSLTLSDTTDGMDGAFGYLDNFQGGLPVPLGLYYITDYAITTGIVQQLQSLGF